MKKAALVALIVFGVILSSVGVFQFWYWLIEIEDALAHGSLAVFATVITGILTGITNTLVSDYLKGKFDKESDERREIRLERAHLEDLRRSIAHERQKLEEFAINIAEEKPAYYYRKK